MWKTGREMHPKQKDHLKQVGLCQRRRSGLAVSRYFEALKICNKKFKLHARRMAEVWGGLSTTSGLTLHILQSVGLNGLFLSWGMANLTNKYFCFDILIVLWQPTWYEKRGPDRISSLPALIKRSWLSNYPGPLSGICQMKLDGVSQRQDRHKTSQVCTWANTGTDKIWLASKPDLTMNWFAVLQPAGQMPRILKNAHSLKIRDKWIIQNLWGYNANLKLGKIILYNWVSTTLYMLSITWYDQLWPIINKSAV